MLGLTSSEDQARCTRVCSASGLHPVMCTSEAEAPDRLVLLEVALEAEGSASVKEGSARGAGPSVAAPSAMAAAAAGAAPRSRDATHEVRWLG